ncbi:MAG: universal stress protein [Proteobacteria bacterium]|nr:universal stress protein [Pseudomonadota bacterium]
MTYKNIMVAIDGSNTSNLALQEAIQLTKDQKANLRIIHVVDENFVNYGETYIDYDALSASCREEGQKILNKMEEIARQSNVKFESQLVELKPFEGRIAEKIVDETKKWPADLLIIGTHGRRGFNHLILGSVAEGVIRIATTPVLLIRGK